MRVLAIWGRAMQRFALLFIRIYQLYCSPYLGRHCRFVPSCSQYASLAITRYGVLKGGWLTIKRLAKCHRFYRSHDWWDPVV